MFSGVAFFVNLGYSVTDAKTTMKLALDTKLLGLLMIRLKLFTEFSSGCQSMSTMEDDGNQVLADATMLIRVLSRKLATIH
jgi:hypothetical protein